SDNRERRDLQRHRQMLAHVAAAVEEAALIVVLPPCVLELPDRAVDLDRVLPADGISHIRIRRRGGLARTSGTVTAGKCRGGDRGQESHSGCAHVRCGSAPGRTCSCGMSCPGRPCTIMEATACSNASVTLRPKPSAE